MGRTITHDPVTRVTRKMHYSESDDSYVVESRQDANAILELNKASYNSYRRASDPHGSWGDLYASIPLVIWGDLCRRGIAFDNERLAAWLDDSENQFVRRRPGTVSRKVRRGKPVRVKASKKRARGVA
jgi:hypothetical protein